MTMTLAIQKDVLWAFRYSNEELVVQQVDVVSGLTIC
jgi:hypothetical protein